MGGATRERNEPGLSFGAMINHRKQLNGIINKDTLMRFHEEDSGRGSARIPADL